ncbi:hypothetical protein BH20CHL6_BH20CHL6_19770 [soil metagenome]
MEDGRVPEPPAKFFVNSGIVSSRRDIHHLLRPLLKQTVSYRYWRAGSLIASGTGWVERIVIAEPAISTFFTPISICVNVDSWEHLEFETRPDQLLSYTLVQGDERVVVEYTPADPVDRDVPVQQSFRFAPTEYVQMELTALGSVDPGVGPTGEAGGEETPGS